MLAEDPSRRNLDEPFADLVEGRDRQARAGEVGAELRERARGEVPGDLHRPYIDEVVLDCEKCGGESYVLIFHSTLKKWRCVSVPYLAEGGDKGSWNLTEVPTFTTCGDALASVSHDFPRQVA